MKKTENILFNKMGLFIVWEMSSMFWEKNIVWKWIVLKSIRVYIYLLARGWRGTLCGISNFMLLWVAFSASSFLSWSQENYVMSEWSRCTRNGLAQTQATARRNISILMAVLFMAVWVPEGLSIKYLLNIVETWQL